MLGETGDINKALELSKVNLRNADAIDALHVKAHLYAMLSYIHASQGEYKKAYEYREQYDGIQDSIFNNESEERVMRLTNELETSAIRKLWSPATGKFRVRLCCDIIEDNN